MFFTSYVRTDDLNFKKKGKKRTSKEREDRQETNEERLKFEGALVNEKPRDKKIKEFMWGKFRVIYLSYLNSPQSRKPMKHENETLRFARK